MYLRAVVTVQIILRRQRGEMGSSETGPKEFQRSADLFPLTAPGVSSLEQFQERERDLARIVQLKHFGLTDDEIRMYREKEEGMDRIKMEDRALREKLHYIYSKLAERESNLSENEKESVDSSKPSTSSSHIQPSNNEDKATFYPKNHPMNSIKALENDLFDHLKTDEIIMPKRRKILRRMQRKEALKSYLKMDTINKPFASVNQNPNSLWDVKEMPKKLQRVENNEIKSHHERTHTGEASCRKNNESLNIKPVYGPKPQTHYTIKDNKIVRLEPVASNVEEVRQEYKAVDIVTPVNRAEERLLEGTKLSIDQIRSMQRFKNYEPGNPSKTLFMKNISPEAKHADISVLFNQFVHDNGAPVEVRLMTGRLRGQAFIHFQRENVAIDALEDVNGTVVKGRPVIVEFGKTSNNIQQ